MNKLSWFLLFLLSSALLRAQTEHVPERDRPEFIISGNIAGDASLLSLALEKLFFIRPNRVIAGRLGFGFNQEFQLFDPDPPKNYFILPHSVTLNLGLSKRSFVEFGIGGSWITHRVDNYYLVYPQAGYRFHPFRKAKFSVKIWGFFPFGQMKVLEASDLLVLPLGVSFGIAL